MQDVIDDHKMDVYRRRVFACEYARQFTGTFYKWGGDDPAGFDCSGFAIEVLKAVGILQRKGDWTAAGLFKLFAEIPRKNLAAGDLVFWQKNNKIIHVEIALNKHLAIGASGGGSNTLTHADAIKHNAYIKARPIDSRPGPRLYADPYRDPFYSLVVP